MDKTQAGDRRVTKWLQMIDWTDGSSHIAARCPACGEDGDKPVRLQIPSPWPPNPLQPQVWCPACGTAFNPTMDQPPYEAVLDPLVDCYLEQNAGIDVMAGVLAAVDPARVTRYMEIGCGFGFLLDYTRSVYGWTTKGFDPGFSARAGRETLGVDIELAYLDDPAQVGAPQDLVLCSEVIEHVFKPEPLLTTLRDVLAPDGVLLITTPSASGIRPETQPGTLLSLLSPGYHFVLYSPRGLELLLRRVGFTNVTVRDLGHTLRAAASKGPLDADFDRRLDRTVYAGYLRSRVESTDAAQPIGMGFRYRLLKETVNLGDYAAAHTAAAAVADSCLKGWNVDIADPARLLARLRAETLPDSIEGYHRAYPFCFGNLLFFMGILAWQGDHDTERAHLWFAAAAIAGERMRAALHVIGADDEETEELTWRARVYAAHVLIWTRPEAATDAIETMETTPSPLLGEAIPARILVPMRAQVFVDLVNLGQYVFADRLAAAAEEPLPADGLATLYFALGILNLNHRKAPRTAAGWFERAHRESLNVAQSNPAAAEALLWPSLYHQAQALSDAGDKDQAAALLRRLLNPGDAGRLPALSQSLRVRATALAAAARLRI